MELLLFRTQLWCHLLWQISLPSMQSELFPLMWSQALYTFWFCLKEGVWCRPKTGILWVWISTLPITRCVTLGESFHLSTFHELRMMLIKIPYTMQGHCSEQHTWVPCGRHYYGSQSFATIRASYLFESHCIEHIIGLNRYLLSSSIYIIGAQLAFVESFIELKLIQTYTGKTVLNQMTNQWKFY